MKSNPDEQELLSLYRGFFIFGDAACLKILYELDRRGSRSFTELKQGLELNPTTLSRRLKLLCDVGILSANSEAGKLRVDYAIADHHKQLKRFLDALERLSFDLHG